MAIHTYLQTALTPKKLNPNAELLTTKSRCHRPIISFTHSLEGRNALPHTQSMQCKCADSRMHAVKDMCKGARLFKRKEKDYAGSRFIHKERALDEGGADAVLTHLTSDNSQSNTMTFPFMMMGSAPSRLS